MNEPAAREWLTKAWHNLSSATLLYDAGHYTDVIAVEIHYACEKSLKSILAYQNKKIPKTHDLIEIYKELMGVLELQELELLRQISEYHIEESHPAFGRQLPPKEEMCDALRFTESLFKKICDLLQIDDETVRGKYYG